ncbi:hypothetical protein Tsp_07273 [Trichinella spiralis]|uniref:hypothetical protein n=1 Tax=Trichinella spiralis TaxID=6334 RepID=UPI0001EFC33E|nr:hypothetical protein Tsp_07273 [Trichinella spiralis]
MSGRLHCPTSTSSTITAHLMPFGLFSPSEPRSMLPSIPSGADSISNQSGCCQIPNASRWRYRLHFWRYFQMPVHLGYRAYCQASSSGSSERRTDSTQSFLHTSTINANIIREAADHANFNPSCQTNSL